MKFANFDQQLFLTTYFKNLGDAKLKGTGVDSSFESCHSCWFGEVALVLVFIRNSVLAYKSLLSHLHTYPLPLV